MDGDARPTSNPDAKNELLYRLMVIAAIAVILVSLVGIASMTGLISRVGASKPNTEAIPDKRENETDGANSSKPTDRPRYPKTVPARSTPRFVVTREECCAAPAVRAEFRYNAR